MTCLKTPAVKAPSKKSHTKCKVKGDTFEGVILCSPLYTRCICLDEPKINPGNACSIPPPTQAWSRRQRSLSHYFRVFLYMFFLFSTVFSLTAWEGWRKIFQSTKYQFWRLCVRKNSTSTSPRDPFSFSEGQPMVYWVIKAILMVTQHLGKWILRSDKK